MADKPEKEKKELKYDTKGRGKTVRYATNERKAKINPKNIQAYQRYLRSRKVSNKDVVNTTYKVYESYMNIFLCYIMEEWDNFDITDEDLWTGKNPELDMIEVMESYIYFLQETLGNNKKSINTKLSAVSSYYVWATKRGVIKNHPFDGKLERMKNSIEEKIISAHFLSHEEVEEIVAELAEVDNGLTTYDKMDQIIWHIAFDSACRIGALHGLTVSSLNHEKKAFENIREKRGKMVSIAMTPKTYDLLLEYLKTREELGIDCDELFYVRKNGAWGGMSKQSLYNRIKKMGHIIGVGDFRPHSIRKTRLNQVAKRDIKKAAALANHDSIDTTSRFYTEKEDQSKVLADIMELEEQGALQGSQQEK